MRLRTYATAAILGATLLPPALADARPAANVTVERAQLRQLMAQRRTLIGRLAAEDGTRGQALTLNALAAADTILSGDAVALERAIRRFTPRPAPAVRRKARKAHKARTRMARQGGPPAAPVVNPPLLLAGPGVLWSPSARAVTFGLPVEPTLTPQAATHAPVAPLPSATRDPLTLPTALFFDTTIIPLTPHVDIGGRLRAPSVPAIRTPSIAPSTAGQAARARQDPYRPAAASRGAARTVVVLLAPADAPSHGRLALAGADGVLALDTANARVAAALLTPLFTPRAPVPSRARHQRRSTLVARARWNRRAWREQGCQQGRRDARVGRVEREHAVRARQCEPSVRGRVRRGQEYHHRPRSAS